MRQDVLHNDVMPLHCCFAAGCGTWSQGRWWTPWSTTVRLCSTCASVMGLWSPAPRLVENKLSYILDVLLYCFVVFGRKINKAELSCEFWNSSLYEESCLWRHVGVVWSNKFDWWSECMWNGQELNSDDPGCILLAFQFRFKEWVAIESIHK